MNFRFHPLAIEELNSSVDYYDDVHPGLGLKFSEEVYSTIQRMLHFPKAWTKISDNCRRCLTQRFPYGIIYYIE